MACTTHPLHLIRIVPMTYDLGLISGSGQHPSVNRSDSLGTFCYSRDTVCTPGTSVIEDS